MPSLSQQISGYAIDFLTIYGLIWTAITIFLGLWTLINVIKGNLHIWWRLGLGLFMRKITVFAKNNSYNSLENLLLDSKLFNKKNIKQISEDSSISSAYKDSIYLVCWYDFENSLEQIINQCNNSQPLIIYAPQEKGRVPENYANIINSKSNSVLVNYKGRMLNDIVTSMITTGFQK